MRHRYLLNTVTAFTLIIAVTSSPCHPSHPTSDNETTAKSRSGGGQVSPSFSHSLSLPVPASASKIALSLTPSYPQNTISSLTLPFLSSSVSGITISLASASSPTTPATSTSAFASVGVSSSAIETENSSGTPSSSYSSASSKFSISSARISSSSVLPSSIPSSFPLSPSPTSSSLLLLSSLLSPLSPSLSVLSISSSSSSIAPSPTTSSCPGGKYRIQSSIHGLFASYVDDEIIFKFNETQGFAIKFMTDEDGQCRLTADGISKSTINSIDHDFLVYRIYFAPPYRSPDESTDLDEHPVYCYHVTFYPPEPNPRLQCYYPTLRFNTMGESDYGDGPALSLASDPTEFDLSVLAEQHGVYTLHKVE